MLSTDSQLREVSDRGIVVFPNQGHTKIPGVKGWTNLLASVFSKSKEPVNYSMLCGKVSNLTVIDIDNKSSGLIRNGLDLWNKALAKYNNNEEIETVVIKTPNGGLHYYFEYDEELKSGSNAVVGFDEHAHSLKWAIDICNDGHAAMCLGSQVRRKSDNKLAKYRYANSLTFEDFEGGLPKVPGWLKEFLTSQIDLKKNGDFELFSNENSFIEEVPKSVLNYFERQPEPNLDPNKNGKPGSPSRPFINPEDQAKVPPHITVQMFRSLVLNQHPSRADSYDSWSKICFIVGATDRAMEWDNFDVLLQFSQQSESYESEEDVRAKYDQGSGKLSFKTLIHMLKQDNYEEYKLFCEKLSHVAKKTLDVADSYYYYDFIDQLKKTVFENKAQRDKFLKENMNRVYARLVDGSIFIKKEVDALLELVGSYGSVLVRHFVQVPEQPPKLVSNNINKVIQTELSNDLNDYNNLAFHPDGKCNPRDFNMWTGFKSKLLTPEQVRTQQKKIQPILDHIMTVWAVGNEKHFKYILSWFHHIFKYPHLKSKVVLVLQSDGQQIGKGIIVEHFLIPYIFGSQLAMYGPGLDYLTDKFNMHLMNKILICIDEAASIQGGVNNFKSLFDAAKSLITSPFLNIEVKHGRKFNAKNFINAIIMTNNKYSINVENNDARYAIFECSDEKFGQFEYFNSVADCFNEECANIFFSYIYHLENPVEIRNIPETQLKKEMKMSCLPSAKKFLCRIRDLYLSTVDNGDQKIVDDRIEFEDSCWTNNLLKKFKDGDYELLSKVFYAMYKSFCEEENERPITATKFGREISGHIDKRRSNGVIYDLRTITL